MRKTPWMFVERYRFQAPPVYLSDYGDDYGAFRIPYPKTGQVMAVLANGAAEDSAWWEHVSVSLPNRCPNWFEMDFIKDLFWLPTETVMQLHVPKADHRSLHAYCLHMWRPTKVEIPRPPALLVAPDPINSTLDG